MPAVLDAPVRGFAAAADDLYATARIDGPLPIHGPASAEKSRVIDQAYSEYRHLRDAGVEVDPDAFCARFPACQTSLRKQLQVHLNVEADPDMLGMLDRWPLPGQEYFGFRIEEELGRGAFGRVYLARQPGLGNRQVVVKVALHSADEADTLAKLRHPNVVPIHWADYDPATEFSIVCMPFLGGTTLMPVIDKVAARKALPDSAAVLLAAARDDRWPAESAAPPARVLRQGSYLEGVLYLGARMADALAFVHERGVLHRDLKPSNVLLCPNGEPVLIDFNLAHDRAVTDYRLGGTLPYMPPEQLQALARHRPGQPFLSDNRSDLYALGVILYEMLTGGHPFGPVPLKLKSADAREFLLEQQRRGPKPLRLRNRDIDPAVEALILRCLSGDPAARPATARELAVALRRLPTWQWRARRWTTAHAKSLTAAAVLACSTSVAGAGYVANLPGHTQNAERHYKDGEYAKAVDEFNAAIEAGDDRPSLYFGRGRAQLKLGRFDAAVTSFSKADPEKDPRVSACMGYACTRADLNGDAATYYTAAEKAGFANSAFLNNLAFCRYSAANYLEAEAQATAALELSPGLIAAHYNRALARFQLWYATRDPGYALTGLEDLQQVRDGGVRTQNSCFFAAALCAAVLKDRYSDPEDAKADPIYTKGLEHLRSAVEVGYPRSSLMNVGSRLKPFMSDWADRVPQDMKIQEIQKGMDLDDRLLDPIID
jgi:serine/threonine protein kinase